MDLGSALSGGDGGNDGAATALLNDRTMNVPGLRIRAIDGRYMMRLYNFFHEEPVVSEIYTILGRFVAEGGVSVKWCGAGDTRTFRNVRATKRNEDDATDDETRLLSILLEALKWRLMFGFVPIQMPNLRTVDNDKPAVTPPRRQRRADGKDDADADSGGETLADLDAALRHGGHTDLVDTSDDLELSRQQMDTDEPPVGYRYVQTAGVAPVSHVHHLLPDYMLQALRRRQARDVARHGALDMGRDMAMPVIPSFGTGHFWRIEDIVGGDVYMTYVPDYLRASMQSADDFKRHIESGLHSVFVWPGMMPDANGRILSPLSPLLHTRDILLALEVNMLDAEFDAAHPPIIHQENPRGESRQGDVVHTTFGDALAGIGGAGGTASSRSTERAARYAESANYVSQMNRELARRRAMVTGRIVPSDGPDMDVLKERRRFALETGASMSTYERMSQRLFALPPSEQMAGSGTQARTWQNVLDHQAAFEDKIYAALGVPRSYLSAQSRPSSNGGGGGGKGVGDTLNTMATLRATVRHAREMLVVFFDYAYDAVNRERDNQYIAQMLDGVQAGRQAALDMLDEQTRRELEAAGDARNKTVLEQIIDEQDRQRRNIEAFMAGLERPYREAKRAERRAKLVFKQTPMVSLAELQYMADAGVISEREEIVLARRALQLDRYDICTPMDTRSIPVDVLARKKRREQALVKPTAGQGSGGGGSSGKRTGGGKDNETAEAASGRAVKQARTKMDSADAM